MGLCHSDKKKEKDQSNNPTFQDQKNPQEYLQALLTPEQMIFFRKHFELKKLPPLEQRWESFLPKSIEDKKSNIKQLDLKSVDNFKLTQKDMDKFTQVELPQVKTLSIENNIIKDKGLQILCQKGNFPNLQVINLQDNGITMKGVRSLVFNKWDKKVTYQLTSVQQGDGGFRLNVGENIPVLKEIVQTKTISEIDALIPVEQNKKLNALNLFLVTPLNDQEQYLGLQSKQLQQLYKKESTKNDLSLATLMIALKQNLGDCIKFTSKSGIKSQLACKIISTGLLGERIRFQHTLQNSQKFKFSDFKGNHKKLKQFQAWYFQYLKKEYGVDTSQITVDKITEGSIRVTASDSSSKAFTKNAKYFETVSNEVKTFFESLSLNKEEFDEGKNYQFPDIQSAQIQKRGGLPYYQPVLCKRYALNVQKLYENNKWLLMDGNKGQWAVGFHGVNNPTQLVQSQKRSSMVNKIRSIMDGREKGNMLKKGSGQACADQICIKSNQQIGQGIYVSPYFLTCLFQYSAILPGQKYHIVLQCRVRPSSIRIPSGRPDYWVVNKREDLRPYGILLFTDAQISQFTKIATSSINAHKAIYRGAQFTSLSWKSTYQNQYNQFVK